MKWGLIILACAAAGGCTSSDIVQEHSVSRPVPPLEAGVYAADHVDVRPVAIHEVEPDYPPELGSILTGKAVVVFVVRANGKVTDAQVVEADDVLFGEAAVHAVLKWRFRPATVKSAPVDCRMTLPFVFTSPYGYGPDESPEPGSPPDASPSGSRSESVTPR